MRFLADQDVYGSTMRLLASLGHDVATAAQSGLAQAEDSELLRIAHEQNRIFVTRDRDFGSLVFVSGMRPGVVYLRILPSVQELVHAEFERVLAAYSEDELRDSFVVVEPGRHRIRRLPADSSSQSSSPAPHDE
jgi:predicted nuclease of predicted toxin-antitoxin system